MNRIGSGYVFTDEQALALADAIYLAAGRGVWEPIKLGEPWQHEPLYHDVEIHYYIDGDAYYITAMEGDTALAMATLPDNIRLCRRRPEGAP